MACQVKQNESIMFLSVSLSGRIIVSDSNNQCVQCFGPNGELRLKFGSRGRSPGQLQRPTGVCALPNGNFAVADYENRVVSVFDATGFTVYDSCISIC